MQQDILRGRPLIIWGVVQIEKKILFRGLPKKLFSSLNFGEVTDGQTESDAYERTVHMHRCAQKLRIWVYESCSSVNLLRILQYLR